MANTKKYVSLDKLTKYDELLKAKIKTDDEAVLTSAKSYAKEYADGLATNYDAAGAAATAESNAKTYTDGKIGEVNGVVAGVKTTAEKGVTDAAAAKTAADNAQSDVDALETYVGTFTHATAKSVVDYVDAKTAGIASSGEMVALGDRVTAVEGDVATIKDNYLDGEDKTELEGKIDAKADQTALDDVSAVANAAVKQSDYNTKVAALEAEDTRIEGLVTAEAERAAGVENGLKGRIETMEAFWAAAQADGTDSNVIDTLKEIQEYIAGDETGASEMAASIKQNSDAISAMDTAYKAADETLQGNIDTLAGVVDGKAAQADLNTLSDKVTTAEGKISANETAIGNLQTADTNLGNRITALEGAIGESGSVADDIATAKQEAIDTAAGDATTKANTAESNAKSHADSLNTAMNTRVEALEAIDHDHSNKTVLDGITADKVTGWDNAAAKVHEHGNKTVLDGITADKVSAWDKAEGNAKSYADGLNTTMDGRVATLEAWHTNFVECSETDINNLFA